MSTAGQTSPGSVEFGYDVDVLPPADLLLRFQLRAHASAGCLIDRGLVRCRLESCQRLRPGGAGLFRLTQYVIHVAQVLKDHAIRRVFAEFHRAL